MIHQNALIATKSQWSVADGYSMTTRLNSNDRERL